MNKIKKETFKRSDIESSLKRKFPDLNKKEVSDAIDIILESIIETVALDGKVEIRGFGSFSKKNIRPRRFINPKTKEESFLGETSIMHFKASKKILFSND